MRDSDATVLFSIDQTSIDASKKTVDFARLHKKPPRDNGSLKRSVSTRPTDLAGTSDHAIS